MRILPGSVAAIALLGACALPASVGIAQTPEQQSLWETQRAQALGEQKARAARLEKERAARKADPMGWERTLDPMSSGGWEFRTVDGDGSWAAFSTNHQLKRSGKTVKAWLRQEFAEPQLGDDGPYLSAVEKAQYDCKKELSRNLLVIYYATNNIQGNEQTEEADPKTTPWNAIVPGTRDESNFLWACNQARGGAK